MTREDRGDAGRAVQRAGNRAERRFGRALARWEHFVDQLGADEDVAARARLEAGQGYDDFLAESRAHLA